MKHLTSLLVQALLPFMAFGQTAVITESLRMVENGEAYVVYNNEFGSLYNKDLDEPFPYVVIRIDLEGDVSAAKSMLSLDLGQMYKIEAQNLYRDNMILYLIRYKVKNIYLLCGDGCKPLQLSYGNLLPNRIYTCKVSFTSKKEAAPSNDEMAEMKKQMAEILKQNEQMQQMLLSMSQNQQQTTTQPVSTTKTATQPVTTQPVSTTKTTTPSATTSVTTTEITQYHGVLIANGVLIKVPKDFKGHFDIHSDIRSIGDNVFRGCTGLTSVTIPNSVTSIGDFAFLGCTGLTSVTIPNSVTSIGNGAFYKCTGLTSMTIPNSVTSIGNGAFYECTGLTSVTIPNSVTRIGNITFSDCKGLTSVTIPDSVTSIGWGAFGASTGLTSVTIPNSVTSIGRSAFAFCTGLTSVTIKGSSTKLGNKKRDVFEDCPNLQAIYVPAGTKKYYQKMLPVKLKKLVIEQ